MPDRKFIGVVGGHGRQVIKRSYPNVQIIEHGPDMQRVWRQTRILFMPSVYESYGMVAAEAAVNGIPTIASPTPGLKENLGEDGIFVEVDLPVTDEAYSAGTYNDFTKKIAANPAPWMTAIEALNDHETYEIASKKALVRAERNALELTESLDQWVNWVESTRR